MHPEIKLLLALTLGVGFFVTYVGVLFTYDIEKDECIIKTKNNVCILHSLTHKECLGNIIPCGNFENNGIIGCFRKTQTFLGLCKLFLFIEDLHQEMEYEIINGII